MPITQAELDVIAADEHYLVPIFRLAQCQVCSRGTIEEALAWVRRTNPSGTTNNWMIQTNPGQEPGPCADIPGRTHYVFEC